jgi:hypothetical protein
VTYSAPVGISLHAKSSDATNGLVTDDKRIATEQGNPYGAFVTEAKTQLAGRSPTAIVVEGAQLSLGDGSTGVTSLAEVFGGNVAIDFLIDDSNNSFGVANAVVDAAAPGTLELDPHFDSGALSEFDYAKLLGGHFTVVARGTAARGFADRGANGDLDVMLTFAAFE